MYLKDENTKLTLESYGNTYHFEANHPDTDIEEILYAFYGLLVAATWQPSIILEGMRDFAEERLEFINYKNGENTNDIG